MSEPFEDSGAAPRALTEEDKTFLRALVDIPEDRTTWLVYADWLEDRGDPRAEFLRLVVARSLLPENDPEVAAADARLAQLRTELDPLWLAVFDPAPVANCLNMAFVGCGKIWTELAPTDVPDVRICHGCRRPVFYCQTADEARMIGSAGEVIALSTRIPPEQNPFPRTAPEPATDEIEMDIEEFLAPETDRERSGDAQPRPWWRFW